MKKTFILQLSVILISFSSLFLILELSLTAVIQENSNGQRYAPIFGRLAIPPYTLDLPRISRSIKHYHSADNNIFIYDANLGWTYRRSFTSENAQLVHNKDGIRTADVNKVFGKFSKPNTLRIQIFGDSFTHGDGVLFNQTWGHQLEGSLNKIGIQSEVLNFGVGGYGMDQAYLRYKGVGSDFSHSIVIFGFSFENILRNVNIFRNIYKRSPAGIIYSKPRFRLVGENLVSVNIPTIDPMLIPESLSNFKDSKFRQFEFFYDDNYYSPRLWQKSNLISVAMALADRHRIFRAVHSKNGDLSKLTIAIIKEFKSSVENNGGIFLIVHLPPQNHFEHYLNSKKFKYDEILNELEMFSPLIRPEMMMKIEADLTSSATLYGDHYSPKGHQIIADAIRDYLAQELVVQ